MRIAFVSAELAPHAHVGGLGDVARSLPAALQATGEDVTVFLPRYDILDPAGRTESAVDGLDPIDLGALGSVSITTLDGPGPRVVLVNAPEWFSTGSVYSGDDENHLRYAVLCQATVAVCEASGWMPEVVHGNDWHTALLPIHAEHWRDVGFVLTIHNLAYQGGFPRRDLQRMGLDPSHPLLAGDADTINPLAVGIRAADLVTTVSPTYAREILTEDQGAGLHDILRAKGDRLIGILNGIGDEWDPSVDPYLPVTYSVDSLDDKVASTTALRSRLGLTERAGVPVAGIVSRLADQKGFELLRNTLPPLLRDHRMQLAVLGSGEPHLEQLFADLATSFPGETELVTAFDPELAHLIEAGADIFLMPSKREPCGLNQMYSQKYGTVPVVHRTGGLADTVSDWDPRANSGTGFTFERFDDSDLLTALQRAVATFADREMWQVLQRNGMAQDFSWRRSAAEYQAAYERAIRP